MTKRDVIKMLRKYFDASEDGKYNNIVQEIERRWARSR